MATYPLTITADQARQDVNGFARKFAKGQRRTPAMLPMLQKISDENQVYIHNVGPWAHRRDCGSWGTFFIPACESGKAFSSMGAIPGIFREPYPTSEKENRVDEYQGDFVAGEILGTGTHTEPRNNFVQFGCFQSPNATPTKDELAKAHAQLDKTALKLYKEAVNAYNQGPKEAEQVITDRHRWAAVHTGNHDAAYIKQFSPEKRQKCPVDGTMSDMGIMLCPTCRYVFDEEGYAKLKGRIAK